jgi:HEAT repeat protein
MPGLVQWEEPTDTLRLDELVMPAAARAEGGWIESGKPEHLPELVRYLRSREVVVQCAALSEFAGMGRKAWPAVPAILDALRDPKAVIRLEAAATLIHMNVRTASAVRVLKADLRAKEAATRADAAGTIGRLIEPGPLGTSCWGPGPPPQVARPWLGKRTLPALVAALRDPEPRVREAAARALGKNGRRAGSALSALIAVSKDRDAKVREAAIEALERIDSTTRANIE